MSDEIKELEEKIKQLMLEKIRLGNGLDELRNQVNANLTKMAQIDGKMELLREIIDEKRKGTKQKENKG